MGKWVEGKRRLMKREGIESAAPGSIRLRGFRLLQGLRVDVKRQADARCYDADAASAGRFHFVMLTGLRI
jgi:hypothetical protein